MNQPEIIGRSLSPAKVNLGLEVLGRRNDGYHEIRTTIQAISLFDRITMVANGSGQVHTDAADIGPDANIMTRAAHELAVRLNRSLDVDFTLLKRIPVAAGLGGGSGNAAAVIRLLCRYWDIALSEPDELEVAAAVGSDVPFFLRGGFARISGRGEKVVQLPPQQGQWFVVVVPQLRIERKTARLFEALQPSDFGQTGRMQTTGGSTSGWHNTFARPLYDLFPDLLNMRNAFATLGGVPIALSGAGPAHYAHYEDLASASALLRATAADSAFLGCRIHIARSIDGPGPLDMGRNSGQ